MILWDKVQHDELNNIYWLLQMLPDSAVWYTDVVCQRLTCLQHKLMKTLNLTSTTRGRRSSSVTLWLPDNTYWIDDETKQTKLRVTWVHQERLCPITMAQDNKYLMDPYWVNRKSQRNLTLLMPMYKQTSMINFINLCYGK